jgi:hypothetical protein
MSNAALSAVSLTADPELLVTVTVDDETSEVLVDPPVLKVPYQFRGYIRWRIEHPNAAFQETPIVFSEGPRTVPPPATPKTCHVWWENANNGATPELYTYQTMLQHGLRRLKPDPTVQNEPPGFVA